jgi:hypothetical protein
MEDTPLLRAERLKHIVGARRRGSRLDPC